MASWIYTGDLRITNSSFGTSTDWSMALEETFCTLTTITRIFANSVDTSFIAGTLIVSDTTRRIVKYNWYAASVRVGHPAFSTRANHGSEGYGVNHRTDCSCVTRVEFVTGIDAFLVDTGSSGRTIRINFTFNNQIRNRLLFGSTEDKGVANVSRRTNARGIMIDNLTDGSRGADIVQKAGV